MATAYPMTCEHCGRSFTASRPDARFCRASHRVAASKRRRAAGAARVQELTREHIAALTAALSSGDLSGLDADLDRIDAEVVALGYPPLPRLAA